MPSPVAANDLVPISGSVQTSRISYAVEPAGKDYGQNYNGTHWYSDIPNDGTRYTIVTDNYTANYYISRSLADGAYPEGGLPAVDEYSAPVFWITTGTSSLDVITTVNGLPDRIGEVPFNSGSQALNWVASSSNYFAVGPDYYKDIDADQLRLFYHANQVISYPTTQSTWYDLSGYTNPNGTLTNGPVWNSNGWIEFDGTNDVVYTTPWALNNEFSYEGTFYIDPSDSSYSGFFGNMYSPSGYSFNGNGWIVRLDPAGALEVYLRNNVAGGTRTILINSFRSTYSGKWFNLAFVSSGSTNTLYVNNTAYNGSAYTVGSIDPSAELLIGAYDWGGRVETYYLKGANEYTRAYSKALTATDVAQNYYGGPVVTSSISGSYNAGNLVSYAPGNTTTYNMAANIVSGSLQNGVGFSPNNGGYWSFDGVDDRILLQGSTQNAWILNSSPSWTVTAWVRVPVGSSTGIGLTAQGILSNTSGGPIYSVFQIAAGVIAYSHYNGGWLYKYGTTPVNDGEWHMLTWANGGNQMDFYVDGIYDGTVASNISGVGWLDVIGNSLGTAFLGDIASVQINNGYKFTQADVSQQYNATN